MKLRNSSVIGTWFTGYDINNMFFAVPYDKDMHFDDLEQEIAVLHSGVFAYNNRRYTMDRGILHASGYHDTYNNRLRDCLCEILTCKGYLSLNPVYWCMKYNLGRHYFEDFREFISWLYESSDMYTAKEGAFNAVCLNNMESVVFNSLEGVVPLIMHDNTYVYYAISGSLGYQHVTVQAGDDFLAMLFGRTEFERCYGEQCEDGFCSLVKQGEGVIRGSPVVFLSYEEARDLCQSVMYGFTQNYKGYASKLRLICAHNGIGCVSDMVIQHLFANNLARKYRYGFMVSFADVVKAAVWFIGVVRSGKAYSVLCEKRLPYVKHDWEVLNKTRGLADGLIATKNGNFMVVNGKLSDAVEVTLQGVVLGSVNV